MRPEDVQKLKNLVGKTVVEIRVSDDEHDYGFDLVFDDGTVLEVYDIRCPHRKKECGSDAGGGVAWTVS